MIIENNVRRIKYTVAFVITLIVEVLIALFAHDSVIRPYVGDVLVVVVIYLAVSVIVPDRYRWLPIYVFLFAVVVECLQYFNLVQILRLENNMFARIIIGSVFDVMDILCYGVGCILLGIYEWIKWRGR
jgi:hypothetical protein